MKSIIKRIGDAWRCCLHGVVGWWRRITGRDRYYIGYDPAYGSDKSAWCICRADTKTGVTTVLEYGTGEPPANEKLRQDAPANQKVNL